MINTLISVLIVKGIFTFKEGEALAQKIRSATLPADLESSFKQVEKFILDIAKEI